MFDKLGTHAAPVNRIRPTMPETMPVNPPGRLLEIPQAHDVVPIETLRVLCSVIFIATRSGTPELTRFRTAVRRKSCRNAPGTPAAWHASVQALRKLRMRSPVNRGPRSKGRRARWARPPARPCS